MESNLLRLLQSGGYILYARHGEATVGADRPDLDFRFCYTQRNLSELGRTQAVYYGNLLRRLQLPVGAPVMASPYCRAVETAQWLLQTPAFGLTRSWLISLIWAA